jgi:tetratricopeptide (TPR) repeat protein
MPIFQIVVAKQCEEPGCPRQRQRVDQQEGFCEECGQPLASVLAWSLPRIALALAVPLGLALLGLALASYIAHRPNPLTGARRQRLTAWARAADVDGVVTEQEQAGLARLVQEERLNPQVAGDFATSVRRRLEESRRAAERGFKLAAQRRYAEAREEYTHAIENDPENAAAWVNLGLVNAACGREIEALDQYSKALQIDPGNWHAHYSLGLLWARRGDSDQALRHLEETLASLPDPASPQRRSMAADLREAVLPKPLQRDPRFKALLTRLGGS